MATRTFKTEKAAKHQVKLKVNMEGPGGSGKTISSLMIAYGLCGDWTKVYVIDTENLSANFYASKPYELTGSEDTYNVVSLEAPYDPESFIAAIEHCENEGAEVIIIDNISHEWNGKGGVLEIVDEMKSRRESAGGTFNEVSPWNKMTPRHTAFIDKMLFSPVHLIATVRCKEEVSMEKDSNGKTKVVKVGMQPQQRDGYGFEFGLTFSLDMSHHITTTKDRTGLFMDKEAFVASIETGKKLKEWCESGNDLVAGVVTAFDGITTKEQFDELFKTSTSYLNMPAVRKAADEASERIRNLALKAKESEEAKALATLRKLIKANTDKVPTATSEEIVKMFKDAAATGMMKEEMMKKYDDVAVYYKLLKEAKEKLAKPAEQPAAS